MSLQNYVEIPLVDDDDETLIWERWREINRIGVIKFSDDEIRDLHSQMSLLLSDAQLKYEILDGAKDIKKLHRELKEAELVELEYSGEKAMNAKLSKAHADKRYQDIVKQIEEITQQRAFWKGKVTATQTAVDALSREISYRIKK